jgi:hypothetical protein
VIVRLHRAGKEAEKCHLRTAGLVMGVERVQSVEFPSLERQQVTMLALDFGESVSVALASSPGSPERAPVLDAPNVVDLAVTALHDLRVGGKSATAGGGQVAGLVFQVQKKKKAHTCVFSEGQEKKKRRRIPIK